MKEFILIGGGVRSGKSAFALQVAAALGPKRVFIATAQPFDSEMQSRISRHQEERGDAYHTIEAPLNLPEALSQVQDADVVVIDCLTLWLSNLLLRDMDEASIAERCEALLLALRARRSHVVLVTNEVGMGVVPDNPLGRTFRDVSGRAHQTLSPIATRLYAAMLGCMVRLRPAPLVVESAAGALSC